MFNGFPCPNPTCSHVFPAGAMTGGLLVCPRCGSQFQFQSAAPVAPPPVPNYPMGRAVGPPPQAAAAGIPNWMTPVPAAPVMAAPPAPPAAPVVPPSDNTGFRLDSQPDLAVRVPRRRSGGGLFVLALLLLGVVGGGIYFAYEKGIRFNVVMPATGDTNASTGGAEARRSTEALLGTRAVYSLRDDAGIWRKDAAQKKYYEVVVKDLAAVDLSLQAADPAKPDDAAGRASILVFVLPRADSLNTAVAAAREVTKQMYKADYPGTRIETIKSEQGDPQEGERDVGEVPGFISLLDVHNSDTRERFVARAVVHRPDTLVVFHCECAFDRRIAWEDYFRRMLASFRIKVRK
jgi:hypothetical protein